MHNNSYYDPAIHHRHSIRLQGYDYSQAGMCFITICTHHHECLFGEIITDSVGAGSKPAQLIRAGYEPAPTNTMRAGYEPAPTNPARAEHEPVTRISTPRMALNEYGKIVAATWDDLVNHVDGIELGEFTIMPNHIHGIIVIVDPERSVGAGSKPAQPTRAGYEPAPTNPARASYEPASIITKKRYALPEIVRQFKTFSARPINEARGTRGAPVWQRNYWEHIIRNEKSYLELHRE